MYDWYDKLMIAICTILCIVVIGGIIIAIALKVGVEPSGEEFDVVGWVANPANPASPLHPTF